MAVFSSPVESPAAATLVTSDNPKPAGSRVGRCELLLPFEQFHVDGRSAFLIRRPLLDGHRLSVRRDGARVGRVHFPIAVVLRVLQGALIHLLIRDQRYGRREAADLRIRLTIELRRKPNAGASSVWLDGLGRDEQPSFVVYLVTARITLDRGTGRELRLRAVQLPAAARRIVLLLRERTGSTGNDDQTSAQQQSCKTSGLH